MPNDHTPAESPTDLLLRLRRLEEENARLRRENDGLKRSRITGLLNDEPFHGDLARGIREHVGHIGARVLLTPNHPRAIEPSWVTGLRLAYVAFDLGYLKYWNTGGHDAGNRALKVFGEKMTRQLPASSTLYHLHGDEFGLVARENLSPLVRSIRQGLADYRQTVIFEDQRLVPTADFGLAALAEGFWAAGELMRSRPTQMAKDDDALVTLVKQLLIKIADFRSKFAKEIERLDLMAELKRDNEHAFYAQVRFLHTGDISSRHIDEAAALDPKDRPRFVRDCVESYYDAKIQAIEERLTDLEGLDGDDHAIDKFALLCALYREPFTPMPR